MRRVVVFVLASCVLSCGGEPSGGCGCATSCEVPLADCDGDGFEAPADCDDLDPQSHPGGIEICDGEDNDCDGEVDEGAVDAAIWYADADGDGFGDRRAPAVACDPPPGHLADGTDCRDDDALFHPAVGSEPPWILDPCVSWLRGDVVASLGGWGELFHSGDCGATDCDPSLAPDSGAEVFPWYDGCSGNGVVVEYWMEPDCGCEVDPPGESCCGDDLASWVVLRWDWSDSRGPIDLGDHDFLLLPVLGEVSNHPIKVEPKLQSGDCMVMLGQLEEYTGLGALRTLVIPLSSFEETGDCALDRSAVVALEIGIAVPAPEADVRRDGIFRVDSPAAATADDLRIDVEHLECPVWDEDLMGRVLDALLALQHDHGMLDTWVDPHSGTAEPQLYVYPQAVALQFFARMFDEFGHGNARDAAAALATALVDTQQPQGCWFDAYVDDGQSLVDGTAGASYEGNTAWVLLGLQAYVDLVDLDATDAMEAIDDGVQCLLHRREAFEQAGYPPGGISTGGEANTSTALALLATGYGVEADEVIEFILDELWDHEAGYVHMGLYDPWLAEDQFTWPVPLLRRAQMESEALLALSLASGVFPTTDWSGQSVGLADFGPVSPWYEGTAVWSGCGGPGAHRVHEELLAVEVDGMWPASGDAFPGGPGWLGGDLLGTSQTAWVGLMGFTPLFDY